MAPSGSPLDVSRLTGSGCASKVTSGADAKAASAHRSSDRRSAVRVPSSANAGTVAPLMVDRVQSGTIVPLTSLIDLLWSSHTIVAQPTDLLLFRRTQGDGEQA